MAFAKTTLERAFELAKSGAIIDLRELRKKLASEGYATVQMDGPSLGRQLRKLIAESRALSPVPNDGISPGVL
jgi:hypothetical protein